jgi:hypothetical protein
MTRYRLSWLLFTLASGAVLAVSCGGDDDTTGAGGSGGKGGSGSGGTTMTGGAAGVGGTGGTGGTAGKDGGTSKDAGSTRIPCGETTCPATQQCDPAGPTGPRCVACLNDMQCANNAQMRLHCDAAVGVCKSCTSDAHCTAPQRCIPGNMPTSNSTCQLRCASDADCATQATNHACNLTTMMCVQCQNNTHCAGNMAGPVCVGNNCEQCGADADCAATPATPVCDVAPNQYVCVQCNNNTQCAEPTPICVLTGANTCRECGANADCTGRPGGGACVTNICRQCSGGANGVPCPAGNTCQMNVCVPIPEAGPPEAGREGGSDSSSEAGSEGGVDAPVDIGADTTSG